MARKAKRRVTHWGTRTFRKIETLCGKSGRGMSAFSEYGDVTEDESRVTCKNCLRDLGRDV